MRTASSISGLVGPPGAKLKEPSKEKPGIRLETQRLPLYNVWCVRKTMFPNATPKLCDFEEEDVPASNLPSRCPKCGAPINKILSGIEEVIYAYG